MDMMADIATIFHQPANVLATMELEELIDWWRRARDVADARSKG